jgi:PAS domain-containing protein
MIHRNDSVQFWTRELSHLRGKALRYSGRSGESSGEELTEALVAASDSLLQELAAARLECERLGARHSADLADWERVFDLIPCAWLFTDSAGVILDANPAASALLNVSIRHLRRRRLMLYTEDRRVFSNLLLRLNEGPEQAVLRLRPRDRGPVDVDVTVMPGPPNQMAAWLWFLTPSRQMQPRKPLEGGDPDPSMERPPRENLLPGPVAVARGGDGLGT